MPSGSPESACSRTKKLFSTDCRSWASIITIRRTWSRFRSILRQADSGPECRQHSARSQSEPLAGCGGGGHFLATVRTHSSRTVFPVHDDRFPHVWKICLRIESLRRSCGLHFLRRRHLGPAHAAGIKPRNCPDPIRMKLRGARDWAGDIQVQQSGIRNVMIRSDMLFHSGTEPRRFRANR